MPATGLCREIHPKLVSKRGMEWNNGRMEDDKMCVCKIVVIWTHMSSLFLPCKYTREKMAAVTATTNFQTPISPKTPTASVQPPKSTIFPGVVRLWQGNKNAKVGVYKQFPAKHRQGIS